MTFSRSKVYAFICHNQSIYGGRSLFKFTAPLPPASLVHCLFLCMHFKQCPRSPPKEAWNLGRLYFVPVPWWAAVSSRAFRFTFDMIPDPWVTGLVSNGLISQSCYTDIISIIVEWLILQNQSGLESLAWFESLACHLINHWFKWMSWGGHKVIQQPGHF